MERIARQRPVIAGIVVILAENGEMQRKRWKYIDLATNSFVVH